MQNLMLNPMVITVSQSDYQRETNTTFSKGVCLPHYSFVTYDTFGVVSGAEIIAWLVQCMFCTV